MKVFSSEQVVKGAAKIISTHDQGSDEYYAAVCAIAAAMTPEQHEALRVMVKCGPLHDGDVPSKQGRDELLTLDLAVRCVVRGNQGYTAARYLGWVVHNWVSAI